MFAAHVEKQIDRQPTPQGQNAKIVLARRQLELLALRELDIPLIPSLHLGGRCARHVHLVQDTQAPTPILNVGVIETKGVVAGYDVGVLAPYIRCELKQHIRLGCTGHELGQRIIGGVNASQHKHLLRGRRHHRI